MDRPEVKVLLTTINQGCPDERELKNAGCGRGRGKSAPLTEKPSLHYRGTSVSTAKRKAIGKNECSKKSLREDTKILGVGGTR